MIRSLWLLASAAALLAAPSAYGQTASAAKPAASAESVADVVVVGQKAAVKADIDRRSYMVGRDLQGSTGSVSDVLRNLPSVEVDVDGNVSLRGDAGVQILIDGQPSTMLSGGNRATMLQQIPAHTVESIEVITNPSAQFSPDGSAGIINIVTKKTFKPGKTGTLIINAGSEGRRSASFSGAMKMRALSVDGTLSLQRPTQKSAFYNFRSSIDPATGQVREILRGGEGGYAGEVVDASLGADYELSPTSRLSGRISHNDIDVDLSNTNTAISTLGGVTVRDYERVSPGAVDISGTQVTLAYRRTFAEPGREFTLNFRRGDMDRDERFDFTNIFAVPAIADEREERRFLTDAVDHRLAAVYTLPLANGGKFVTGYELTTNDILTDTYGGLIDPVTGVSVSNPAVTNVFDFGQTIHAAYGTYQRPFGKLTVMAGLRLEQAIIDTNQMTSNLVEQNDYFGIYPTLHLQHELTENQKITFSYSRRVTRPSLSDYNPYLFYRDEFSIGRGNPRLKPQQTHSVEVGWRNDRPGRLLMANLYVRKTYDAFGPITTFYTPTILLNTVENVGTSVAGGLELTATGKLSPRLSYNATADTFYREIDVSYFGGPLQKRPGLGYTLKGSLDFRVTPKDFLQISGQFSGRNQTPQGYRAPSGTLNIGYRRTLRDDLQFTATVADVLRTTRYDTIYEVDDYHSISRQKALGRVVMLGFTKQFGGKVREGQFDYSAGSSAGGGAP